jgi:hypothetical protein
VDGFEVVGDVRRKRVKEKEVGKEFLPNSSKGAWTKMFGTPDSNYTMASRLKVRSVTEECKFYPNSLKVKSP